MSEDLSRFTVSPGTSGVDVDLEWDDVASGDELAAKAMDGLDLTPAEQERLDAWWAGLDDHVSAKSLSDALSGRMEVIGEGDSEMTQTKIHFDPAEHPRHPKGTEHGGEFMDVLFGQVGSDEPGALWRTEQTPDPTEIDLMTVAPTTVNERAVDDAADTASGQPTSEIPAGDTQDMRVTYDIPAYRLSTAEALIARANRRAERAKIPHRFEYTVERYDRKQRNPDTHIEEVQQRAKITLNRPTIEHDGWTFLGTMEWTEGGLVTRVAPGVTLKHRPEAKRCDACGVARNRIDTYLVRGPDGEEKQVGSNCLETFLGVKPGTLWMLQWDEIASQESGEEGWGFSGGGEVRYDPASILTLGIATMEAYGWVPRSKADEWGRMATVDVMKNVLDPPTRETPQDRQFREGVIARAAELDDKAAEVLEFAQTIDGDSDYVYNLRALANSTTVGWRDLGLLISAIAVKNRRDEQRATEKVAAKVSEHIGTVGEKITAQPARITGVRYIDGQYGVTTLLTFVTPEGNVIKWFASGSHAHEIGDEVTIDRATIKGHGEWHGVKETTITRAKLTVVPKP